MRTLAAYLLTGVVAGAIASQPAAAFEQTPSAPSAAAAMPQQPLALDSGPLTAKPKETEDGRKIRVPGLGSLGLLPKLDFGLELLYGSQSEPGAGTGTGAGLNSSSVAEPKTDSDVTIMGTVKRRF